MKFKLLLSLLLLTQFIVTAQTGNCIGDTTTQPRGIFISTGDNNWTGEALPIDSRAAIDASMDLIKGLGYGRVYWRGLEGGCWMKKNVVRKEAVRSYELWKRIINLYNQGLDLYASQTAKAKGMQFWGVGNIADWASQADAPPTDDYPFNSESRLRIDSPQWVPHDKFGVMRQGGTIDFGYPNARKAMRNLHMEVVNEHQYDGVMLLTYSENHTVRYQDEFGYNDSVVNQFKKLYAPGFNFRTDKWTRAASRSDWVQLRGKHFTDFLREFKDTLRKTNRKLALISDPHEPHYTQPWNVDEIIQTGGPIYQDLETWIKDSIADQLIVFGYANGHIAGRVLDKMLWLTKGTKSRVAQFASSPVAAWYPYPQQRGVAIIHSFHEDEMYLQRSDLAAQPVSALTSPNKYLRMKILSQLIYEPALMNTVAASSIAPLASDSNLIIRRMALKALGLKKDTNYLAVIENGLNDPENAVRSIAAYALRFMWASDWGYESIKKMLAVVDTDGNHSFNEIVIKTITTHFTSTAYVGAGRDSIKARLTRAYLESNDRSVKYVCLRILQSYLTRASDVTFFSNIINTDTAQTEHALRYFAAFGLAGIYINAPALDSLIKFTTHWDPVVANRAASSLGFALTRKFSNQATTTADSTVVASKREAIRSALEYLFSLQRSNTGRIDSAWGYRPVGNALLALGTEGENMLKAFMNQTNDKKLADRAWKVLYVRQKPNSFSEIRQEDAEEGFKHRPAWLDQ